MRQLIYDELTWRGLIFQQSDPDGIQALLNSPAQAVYAGFDPTGASLHIGHLVPLLALRRFQLQGHTPLVLIGGATGLIGDPSGRNQERALNSREMVSAWVEGIRAQVARIIDLSASGALLLDNYQWVSQLSAIALLRDIGKHFSVNTMIAKESVKSRLGREDVGISYTEFSYIILQAFDYLHLCEQHNCRLQIGGSDQWGNITAGIELIRKRLGREAYAFTMPLITTASGQKFGKTASGAVWLDAERTSPYALYQYFINTDDRDVAKYLRYFTLLEREAISALAETVANRLEQRQAQQVLAYEVTALIHGKTQADNVVAACAALFSGEKLRDVDFSTLSAAVSTAPTVSYPLLAALPALPALLVEVGLSASKGQARRDITSGAIYVNNARVTNEDAVLTECDFIQQQIALLRKGKKHYGVVKLG